MARRLNEEWMKERQEAVSSYFNQGIIPERQIFTWNVSCKWYIKLLTEKDVPFEVIQKGAGVKEVVVKAQRCAMCKGRGYIQED